jgi:hypothetical protein
MVKHKQRQALFDLLRKEHPDAKPPEAAPPQPAATVRPVAPSAPAPAPVPAPAKVETPRPETHGPMTQTVVPRSTMVADRVSLTYGQLALAAVGVLGLCVICFVLGQRFGSSETAAPPVGKGAAPAKVIETPTVPGPTKPGTPPVKSGTPGKTPPLPLGSVAADDSLPPAASPGPDETASPVGRPAVAEPPAAASGRLSRVRILTMGMAQTQAMDQLVEYLAKKGVETTLENAQGGFILFSKARAEDREARKLAAEVNKLLEEFQKETGIRTSHDALAVPVK